MVVSVRTNCTGESFTYTYLSLYIFSYRPPSRYWSSLSQEVQDISMIEWMAMFDSKLLLLIDILRGS